MEIKRIDELVEIVREQNNNYWKKESRKRAFEILNRRLTEYFNLKPSKIIVKKNLFCFGCCDIKNHKIIMNRYSLITFLHEFFHKIFPDEYSVRLLSSIIFSLAYPRRFRKLILHKGILQRKKRVMREKRKSKIQKIDNQISRELRKWLNKKLSEK